MTILRNLLRTIPFPVKLRVAKLLYRLGRPVLKLWRPLRGLATPRGVVSTAETGTRARRQILVVLDRLPLPAKDAARVRMLAILRILSKFSSVTLILLYHRFEDSGYERTVRELGVEIAGVFDFDEVLPGRRFDAAIVSYPHVADYMVPEVRRLFPGAKIVFDTVDVQFVRLGREAAVKRSRRIAREAEKLKSIETRLANTADQTWCVTSDDREFLQAQAPSAAIRVVSNIHAVHGRGASFGERSGLLFIGNFEHRPNVDAVNWLLDDIMPLVHAELPGTSLHIVGGGLPAAIRDRRSETCIIHGFVEDVEPLYREARVFVAPLRFGGGMKGKVGESLSFGVPVVTSGIGAEGFGLTDGEDVLLAEDAAGFAAHITRVYHNREMWQTLSDNGLAFIAARLSPDAAEARIREALDELLPGRGISER